MKARTPQHIALTLLLALQVSIAQDNHIRVIRTTTNYWLAIRRVILNDVTANLPEGGPFVNDDQITCKNHRELLERAGYPFQENDFVIWEGNPDGRGTLTFKGSAQFMAGADMLHLRLSRAVGGKLLFEEVDKRHQE